MLEKLLPISAHPLQEHKPREWKYKGSRETFFSYREVPRKFKVIVENTFYTKPRGYKHSRFMCNLCAGVRLIPDRLQVLHPAAVEQINPAGIETASVWGPAKGSDMANVPVPETALPAPPLSETVTPPLLHPDPPQLLAVS